MQLERKSSAGFWANRLETTAIAKKIADAAFFHREPREGPQRELEEFFMEMSSLVSDERSTKPDQLISHPLHLFAQLSNRP
jgi:hypothetical protein